MGLISIGLMRPAQCDAHLYQGTGLTAISFGALAVVGAGMATSWWRIDRKRGSKVGAVGLGLLASFLLAFGLLLGYLEAFMNGTC